MISLKENRVRKFIVTGLLVASLAIAGCSALTKQETSQSNLPTAESLKAACAAGAVQVPAIRAGACDDFNLVQSACLSLTSQPVVPAQSLLACTANGYAITGSFTRL